MPPQENSATTSQRTRGDSVRVAAPMGTVAFVVTGPDGQASRWVYDAPELASIEAEGRTYLPCEPDSDGVSVVWVPSRAATLADIVDQSAQAAVLGRTLDALLSSLDGFSVVAATLLSRDALVSPAHPGWPSDPDE